MDIKWRYLAAIWLLTYSLDFVACHHCTEEEIDQCWMPMWSLPDHLTWESIVPTLSKQQMRRHCQLFEGVEKCLLNLQDHCNVLDQKSHEGVIAAYTYLCEEAFDEYLTHRQCFANTDLHSEGAHCNKTLTAKLDSIDNSKSSNFQASRICQYANDYLDCVENAVKSFCGSQAAAWQRKLDTHNIQPILSLANCQLDGNGRVYLHESHTRTYIIITCIVIITVILLLLFMSVGLMYKSRKSPRQPADTHIIYNSNGSVAIGNNNIATTGNTDQAEALPQKFPDPPPYLPTQPPPVYTTPSEYKNEAMSPEATTASVSVISTPPPYNENEDQAQNPMGNAVYQDFSKNQGGSS